MPVNVCNYFKLLFAYEFKTVKPKTAYNYINLVGCQRWEVGDGWNEWSGQNAQTFSYKINKVRDVICSMVTVVHNTVLYIWKLLRLYLKNSHHKEKLWLCDMIDVNQTYCDDHCTTYTFIKSLGCTL